jgi:hypothetical protein
MEVVARTNPQPALAAEPPALMVQANGGRWNTTLEIKLASCAASR